MLDMTGDYVILVVKKGFSEEVNIWEKNALAGITQVCTNFRQRKEPMQNPEQILELGMIEKNNEGAHSLQMPGRCGVMELEKLAGAGSHGALKAKVSCLLFILMSITNLWDSSE